MSIDLRALLESAKNVVFTICATLLLWLVACSGGTGNGGTTTTQDGSSAGASTGNSAVASSGGSSGASSGGATGTTGSDEGTGATTGGATGTNGGATSSGTTGGPPVFVDAGYVRCALASAPDAGPKGDGGPAFWDCAPGTYFCDTTGSIGACAQCRSDADCLDQSLPTFDPRKTRCDTASGVFSAEHFCQECLSSSDCTGNPRGSHCDVSTTFPTNSQQPPIESVGFETCITLVADCRVDGGPTCFATDQYCDSQTGSCLTRPGVCKSDDDCQGYLSPYNAYVPQPYCSGGFCSACPGGSCPSGFCTGDEQCGNGTVCDLATLTCGCADNSQCGGLWPLCLDIQTIDAGLSLGTCGCDDDGECGDGGLVCLSNFGSSFCGIPCTSPDFPASCQDATSYNPVCNPQTGLCIGCTNDNQCGHAGNSAGPRCDVDIGGFGSCGCDPLQNDCPEGYACQPGFYYGTCAPALSHCTPESCGSNFCNWDSGACVAAPIGASLCVTDLDCANNTNDSTCLKGTCIECQSNGDCLASGAAAQGRSMCCLPGLAACQQQSWLQNNSCADTCAVDADCTGNGLGDVCVLVDGGLPYCGCASDTDCTGSPNGHHCNRQPDPETSAFGVCNCESSADCSDGASCSYGYCTTFCTSLDAGSCGDGYFCDPNYTCRPRCDDGNTCQGQDSACDAQNVGGQNGALYGDADAGGITWCYSCVSADDCPAGQGCDPRQGCGHCFSDASCPAGTACIAGGICQTRCNEGTCPSGEMCDVNGIAGHPDVCYQCITSADCPSPEGCNGLSHTCGSCIGPNAFGGLSDCQPDAICSNYWSYRENLGPGVCLANCDRTPCPASEPICAVNGALTPDHKYCFGCLKDSDCAPTERCNLSPDPTFTCVAKD